MDIAVVLIAFIAQFRVNRMICRRDRDIRAEHDVVTDKNMTVIDQCRVRVHIDVIAEMNVMSTPVCMKRQFNVVVITAFGEYFLHICFFFLIVSRLQLIECPEFVLERALLGKNFLIPRMIDKSFDHAFILRHKNPSFCV